MISFEEAAVAFAKQVVRAEQAEAKVKELEKTIDQLLSAKPIEKK